MPISKIKTSSITADAASVNLNIDSGTLFLDVANNNVGVGRSSASFRLDVAAPVTLTNLAQFLWNDGTYNPRLQFLGSTSGITINETYSTGAGNLMFAIGGTEMMRLNSSGNLGVGGATPSAWKSDYKGIQFSPTAALINRTNTNLYLSNNWYIDSGNTDRYIQDGYSTFYTQNSGGQHAWYNAVSGTAGGAITFNQAMNLDATSNLTVFGNVALSGQRYYRVDARYNGTYKGIMLYQSGSNGNFAMGEVASDTWAIGTASVIGTDVISPRLQWGASSSSGLSILGSTLTATESTLVRHQDFVGNYFGKISTYNYGGYNQAMRFYTTNSVGNAESLAMEIGYPGKGVLHTKEIYSTYVKSMATPNGGTQNVRIIEDSLGRWILVGRFAADASQAISNKISTVRGLDTGLSQSVATAFSADWGDAYPTEVRVMGSTDFQYWKDNRTIDWVYRVPSGRTWATFFNGGSSTMDQSYTNPAGGGRYGFNVAGAYDGFGRWNNPNMTSMGMSDTATTNPSSAYTSPSANALDWYTSGTDSKLAVIHTGGYAGQDYNATASFGYDDGGNNFFDAYPSTYNNNTGTKMFTSSVWILIKLN